jgi:hypothetical protein
LLPSVRSSNSHAVFLLRENELIAHQCKNICRQSVIKIETAITNITDAARLIGTFQLKSKDSFDGRDRCRTMFQVALKENQP